MVGASAVVRVAGLSAGTTRALTYSWRRLHNDVSPPTRMAHGLAANGSALYLIGGKVAGGAMATTIPIFDTGTGRQAPAVLDRRRPASPRAPHTLPPSLPPPPADTLQYAAAAATPGSAQVERAATTQVNGSVWIAFGGINAAGTLRDTLTVVNTVRGTVTAQGMGTRPSARHSAAAVGLASCGNPASGAPCAIVFGGRDGAGYPTNLWRYAYTVAA